MTITLNFKCVTPGLPLLCLQEQKHPTHTFCLDPPYSTDGSYLGVHDLRQMTWVRAGGLANPIFYLTFAVQKRGATPTTAYRRGSSVVEQWTENPCVLGSIPSRATPSPEAP